MRTQVKTFETDLVIVSKKLAMSNHLLHVLAKSAMVFVACLPSHPWPPGTLRGSEVGLGQINRGILSCFPLVSVSAFRVFKAVCRFFILEFHSQLLSLKATQSCRWVFSCCHSLALYYTWIISSCPPKIQPEGSTGEKWRAQAWNRRLPLCILDLGKMSNSASPHFLRRRRLLLLGVQHTLIFLSNSYLLLHLSKFELKILQCLYVPSRCNPNLHSWR